MASTIDDPRPPRTKVDARKHIWLGALDVHHYEVDGFVLELEVLSKEGIQSHGPHLEILDYLTV